MTNDSKTSRKAEALLTVRDVAELDGCSQKTVRRAIDAELLRPMRIGPCGHLIRIHPADHAAYGIGTADNFWTNMSIVFQWLIEPRENGSKQLLE